jgi:hypothetical protein
MTVTPPRHAVSLVDSIEQVLIIAYKESTELLEHTLVHAGFGYEVLRQHPQPDHQNFSPSYRCLLNHWQAWQRASVAARPTLIIEADFVPVVGLGQLPLPCNPKQPRLGITWLYLCAPQLYSLSQEGFAEGFSTSMVAYIVTPESAKALMELAEAVREQAGPFAYSTWDSTVDRFLRDRGFKNYIAFRNYGEHGGRPNPEHRQHGLSSEHRADVLYGKLSFLPLYAVTDDKKLYRKYIWIRLQGRLKGLGRLLLGKFLRFKVLRHSSTPIRLVRFTLARQFVTRL